MASIWDETINDNTSSERREYPVLPEGRYQFEVVKVTGNEFQPRVGSKIGKCAEIDVQLRVEGKDQDVNVFDRLYSDPRTIWKMTAFAKCIGIFEAGMTPGQILRKSEGCIGQADITLRPATDEYPARNEVKSYIVPAAKAAPEKDDLPF